MARNHLGSAGDDDLVHVATDQHLLVPIGRRHRVVIQPIAHQRERVDAARLLVASVVGSRQRLLERGEIVLQPLADRAVMAAQSVRKALPATLQKMRVQCLESANTGIGTRKFRRAYPTSPSTLPLSLPLPGRPNRSVNR